MEKLKDFIKGIAAGLSAVLGCLVASIMMIGIPLGVMAFTILMILKMFGVA